MCTNEKSRQNISIQKQPPRGVPRKRCSKNIQQMYRRTPMPKCDFNKVAKHPCRSVISIKLQSKFFEITLRHGCFPANLLHIFKTSFPRNTSRRLLPSIHSGDAKEMHRECFPYRPLCNIRK